MTSKYRSARSARRKFDALWFADHVLGAERVDRLFSAARGRVNAGIADQIEAAGFGEMAPVEQAIDLSPANFHRAFVRPGIPVVLKGAARGWPAASWTPRTLADRFGDTPVNLIKAAREDLKTLGTDAYTPDGGVTTLGEVADDIEAGRNTYGRFLPLLTEHPELLEELDLDWIGAMKPAGAMGLYTMTFLGGAGTTTGMHNALGSNLFVQLYGKKTWWLIHPDYSAAMKSPLRRAPYNFSAVDPEAPDPSAFPLWPYVRGYQVTLEPGDVLYNPPFYWHYVRNPTDSLGVGLRFYDVPSMLRASPLQTLLTVMATNPPAWTGRKLRFDFTRVFLRSQ